MNIIEISRQIKAGRKWRSRAQKWVSGGVEVTKTAMSKLLKLLRGDYSLRLGNRNIKLQPAPLAHVTFDDGVSLFVSRGNPHFSPLKLVWVEDDGLYFLAEAAKSRRDHVEIFVSWAQFAQGGHKKYLDMDFGGVQRAEEEVYDGETGELVKTIPVWVCKGNSTFPVQASSYRALLLEGCVVPADHLAADLMEVRDLARPHPLEKSRKRARELSIRLDGSFGIIEQYDPRAVEALESRFEEGRSTLLFNQHHFPIGLVEMAKETLEWEHIEVKINDMRPEGASATFEWRGPRLRQYQRAAKAALLRDGGGTLVLPPGAGKTLTATSTFADMGKRTIIFVNRNALAQQWAKNVRKYLGEEPGICSGGEFWEGEKVTIATLQTATSRLQDFSRGYGVIVVDEVHHVPAETFAIVADHFKARVRIGLSATPYREDGQQLGVFGRTGGISHTISVRELVDLGFLARPKYHTVRWEASDDEMKISRAKMPFQRKYGIVMGGINRNSAIAAEVRRQFRKGHHVAVDVNRIEQAETLWQEIHDLGVPVVSITSSGGSIGTDEGRSAIFRAFLSAGWQDPEAGQQNPLGGGRFVLISTLINEGVDLPPMTAIFFTRGLKGVTQAIQVSGRVLRPKPGDVPQVGHIFDVDDSCLGDRSVFAKHYRSRQRRLLEYLNA